MWPERYIDRPLSTVAYLNDSIRSQIEKDIVSSAGVQKQGGFGIVPALLAARTGMLPDYSKWPGTSGFGGGGGQGVDQHS